MSVANCLRKIICLNLMLFCCVYIAIGIREIAKGDVIIGPPIIFFALLIFDSIRRCE